MPIGYAVSIDALATSAAADDPASPADTAGLDRGAILHVRVGTTLTTPLTARYRKINQDGSLGAALPFDQPHQTVGGSWEFLLGHYMLDAASSYLLQVADVFGQDPKCVASIAITTLKDSADAPAI